MEFPEGIELKGLLQDTCPSNRWDLRCCICDYEGVSSPWIGFSFRTFMIHVFIWSAQGNEEMDWKSAWKHVISSLCNQTRLCGCVYVCFACFASGCYERAARMCFLLSWWSCCCTDRVSFDLFKHENRNTHTHTQSFAYKYSVSQSHTQSDE